VVVNDAGATAWQRPELVGEFLGQRARLLPQLDVQEELIEDALRRHAHPVSRFLDIGAGDGAMARLVQRVHPHAEAVLVDNSKPMLERAERGLAGVGHAGRIVAADLRDPAWCEGLEPASFGAAVSGLAIHHLTSRRKRELFTEVYELLEPGAMFLNMDVVLLDGPLRGLFDERMVANALELEHEHGGDRSEEQVEHELLADDSDDQPDRAGEQLRWLAQAGFVHSELHFKWAEAATFGAIKPQEGGT
jgi:tRNA (cmo5U34)-methyltransferase